MIIDGGNSNYKESAPLVAQLAASGIALVDAGTSGGIWGLTEGYCLMVGGTDEAVALAEPIFLAARARGRVRARRSAGCGPFRQDGPQRHRVRADGGVRGRLRGHVRGARVRPRPPPDRRDLAVRLGRAELAPRARRAGAASRLRLRPGRGRRGRLGRGPLDRIQEAIDRGVAAPVISSALFARFASTKKDAFGLRLVAALRNQFGGHAYTTAAGTKGGETSTPK